MTEDYTPKIFNFGLSRDIYERSSYHKLSLVGLQQATTNYHRKLLNFVNVMSKTVILRFAGEICAAGEIYACALHAESKTTGKTLSIYIIHFS